jgi:hypothetical protein
MLQKHSQVSFQMSKQTLRKFRKTEYSYEEENEYEDPRFKVNKRKEKRIERAIRTKDVSVLLDDDDYLDEVY